MINPTRISEPPRIAACSLAAFETGRIPVRSPQKISTAPSVYQRAGREGSPIRFDAASRISSAPRSSMMNSFRRRKRLAGVCIQEFPLAALSRTRLQRAIAGYARGSGGTGVCRGTLAEASVFCDLVVPHVMGELPFAVGLFAQDVQEYSFVRRLGGVAILHRSPCDFVGAPHGCDFTIAGNVLRRYDQFC